MNPSPTKSKTAVLYVRVSSKEQEKEGFSIPAQYKLLRDYAASNGLAVLKEFEDVETAKKSGREGFADLVSFLKKNTACKNLLVEKTDRLYRNFRDWVTLDDLGLDIFLVKENLAVGPNSRSSEKFVHGIKVLMAKNYIDNLGEEASKGMLQKAREGYWPSLAPLGYRNALDERGKKTIEPDPDKAPLVVMMFEKYSTGEYTLKEICSMAKDAGLRFRKSKNPLPKGSVQWILKTRLYCGEFVWKELVYPGNYKPIISKELWDKCQAVMKYRTNHKTQKAVYDYTYSGLVRCGHCGCAMAVERKKGKFIYYHCTGNRGKCGEPYTREEVLESHYAENLSWLRLPPDVLQWLKAALRESLKDTNQFHTEALTRLQGEWQRLKNRLDAMYEDKLDGRIDQALFDRKATEYRAEQARIMEDIAKHQNGGENHLEAMIRILDEAPDIATQYLNAAGANKRELVKRAFTSATWKGGNLYPIYRQPFDLLARSNRENTNKKAVGMASNGDFEIWLG